MIEKGGDKLNFVFCVKLSDSKIFGRYWTGYEFRPSYTASILSSEAELSEP